MDVDAVMKAAVEYVLACGPIWEVENCSAQDEFRAKLLAMNAEAAAPNAVIALELHGKRHPQR